MGFGGVGAFLWVAGLWAACGPPLAVASDVGTTDIDRRVSCRTAPFLEEGGVVPTVYSGDFVVLIQLAPPNATTPRRVTLAYGHFKEAAKGNFEGFKTVDVPESFLSSTPTQAYPGAPGGAIIWGGCYYLFDKYPGSSMLCLESGLENVTYSRPYRGPEDGSPYRVEYFGASGGYHFLCSQSMDPMEYKAAGNCTSVVKPAGLDHVRIIRVNTWGVIFFGKSELVFSHACQYELGDGGKDLRPKVVLCRDVQHFFVPRGDSQYQADRYAGYLPIISKAQGVYSVYKLKKGLIAQPTGYNSTSVLALPAANLGYPNDVNFARFTLFEGHDHWSAAVCTGLFCGDDYALPAACSPTPNARACQAALKELLVNYNFVSERKTLTMMNGYPRYGNVASSFDGAYTRTSSFPQDVLHSYVEITAPQNIQGGSFMFGITTSDSVQLCYGSVYGGGPSVPQPFQPTPQPNTPHPTPDSPGLFVE